MNFFKNRIAWISCGAGVIMTFFLTAGKIIEPSVIFFRYLMNAVVFFILGAGLPWAWKRFVEPVLNAPSSDYPDRIPEEPGSGEEGKGSRFDFSVSGNEEVPADSQDDGTAPVPGEPLPGAKKPSGKDFEIQDEFIIIKDRKLPNNPKLMAEAIKTKLSE